MNIPVDTTFRAIWIPTTQDFGNLGLNVLSTVTARIGGTVDDGGEIVGGVPPYTIIAIVFLGGAPAAEVTIVQSTTVVTGDTIQIQTGLNTPTGNYGGTIRAQIRDSSVAVQTIFVDLIYTVDVVNDAVNTADAIAASLNPSHWWPLDDIINVGGLNQARDIGIAATKYPLETLGSQTWEEQSPQLHMPGPARGTPRSPAMWNSRNGPTHWRAPDGPTKFGWLTGGFSCWFFPTNAGDLVNEQIIMSEEWSNNSGLWAGIAMEPSTGQLFCELTWNNNPRYKEQTVAGSQVNFMEWNHFAAIQRADGNGIILYVNGVPVSSNTPNLSGTLTVDSWIDAVMQSESSLVISVPTNDGTGRMEGAFYHPMIWVNNPPSAAQILAYYNSVADSFAADAVDYYDQLATSLRLPNAKALRYWFEGTTVSGGNGETTEIGYISQLSNDARFSGSGVGTPPTEANQLSPYPVTGYRADRTTLYGTNNPTYFVTTGEFRSEGDEEAISSLLAWVKIEDISISTTKRQFMGMGQGGLRQLAIGVEGDRLFCQVYINTQVDSYTRTVNAIAPQSLRVEVGKYYLLAVTQPADGGGYRLYINGIEASGTDGVDTFVGAGDADYWLATMGGGSQWGLRVGGVGGSQSVNNWKPNELQAWYWADRALTQQQILAIYNAGVPTPDSFAAYITANLTGRRHDYLFDEASGNIIDSGSAPENLDTFVGTALEYEQWGYQPADAGQVGIDFNFTSVAQSNTIAANFWGDDTSGTILLFGYFAATNDPGTYYFMSGLQSAASPPRNGAGIFWLPSSNRLGIFLSGAVGNNYDQRWEVPGGLPINRALVIAFVQRSDGGGIRCFLNGTELVAAASTPLGTFDVDSWLDEVGDPTTFFVGNINFSGGDFTAASRMMRLLTTNVALTTQQVEDLNVAAGVDVFVPSTASIANYITSLAPIHRYTCGQASGTLIDIGSIGGVDLVEVGTLTYLAGGPDASTESIDADAGGDFARNNANAWGALSGATTIICFVKQVANGTFLLHGNTSNEINSLGFGNNALGYGTPDRLSIAASTVGFADTRAWEGDVDIGTWISDGEWHVAAFVNTAANAKKLYTDGVENTVSQVTQGTPPGSTTWFDTYNVANSRAVLWDGRYNGGASHYTGQQSEVLIFDRELTPAEILGFFTRITN